MILWLTIYGEYQVSRLGNGNNTKRHDGNGGPMTASNQMRWEIFGTYKIGFYEKLNGKEEFIWGTCFPPGQLSTGMHPMGMPGCKTFF